MSEKGKSHARVSSNLPCGRLERTKREGEGPEGSEPSKISPHRMDWKEQVMHAATPQQSEPTNQRQTSSPVRATNREAPLGSNSPSTSKGLEKEAVVTRAKGKEGLSTESACS